MTAQLLNYQRTQDFEAIWQFLHETYEPGHRSLNWLPFRWEYAHFHPAMRLDDLHRCGVWADDGQIVGLVHFEMEPGELFFQVRPGYEHLKPAMFEYAEQNLFGLTKDGRRYLNAEIHERDSELQALARDRGFVRGERPIWTSEFCPPEPFPPLDLPEGFRLQSLADENDLVKLNRVLWRGFNHPGEPDDDLDGRRLMQSAPRYRRDLNIVAVAPDGRYVAYAGLWYDPVHQISYVEPVATDPDFRRMGLGKAAVLEGIRRCAAEGARVAYVGSDQPFYLAMGFRRLYADYRWRKEW